MSSYGADYYNKYRRLLVFSWDEISSILVDAYIALFSYDEGRLFQR
jgi:hypothetical protein